MAEPQVAPYGSWKSPITSDLIVSRTIGLGQIRLDSEDIYWSEMRPDEGGRNVIVRRTPDGAIADITPPPFNVRTRVHEYGGGAFTVLNGSIYFSNFTDQRLYVQTPGAPPRPLTPEGKLRYADGVIDFHRGRLICICEDHTAGEHQVVNCLISLDLEASGKKLILARGNDFYSSPCLSPDGLYLAWLTWNHPNMPWDGTELWVSELKADGSLTSLQRVAGGIDESIFQPRWSPDGVLHFVSDRSGWWNLYCWRQGQVEPLWEREAEFGMPQWLFGLSTYDFASADEIICAYTQQGTWNLAQLNRPTQQLQPIETPYSEIMFLQTASGRVIFRASSATEPPAIVHLDLATRQVEVLRRSSTVTLDAKYFSHPQAIEFPTQDQQTAYAFFYPPQNADYAAPSGERPPLLVMSHGGPTAAASSTFSLEVQYWTGRGIAVLDVNYGGSTGYGRAYRQRLTGQWGVVDVDDCTDGAHYLVERREVDGARLAITGGSAGGYTTLCVLTFRDLFKAGASHFGVSDLEALVRETHKFESTYLFRLVGPYPERVDLYRARSPIHFSDRLACPVIFFQGLEDRIVPPTQAELMFEALRTKGVPVAYVPFAGEQHGFRRSENIKRALDGELYFYSQTFAFDLAEPLEPVLIENL